MARNRNRFNRRGPTARQIEVVTLKGVVTKKSRTITAPGRLAGDAAFTIATEDGQVAWSDGGGNLGPSGRPRGVMGFSGVNFAMEALEEVIIRSARPSDLEWRGISASVVMTDDSTPLLDEHVQQMMDGMGTAISPAHTVEHCSAFRAGEQEGDTYTPLAACPWGAHGEPNGLAFNAYID